MAAEDLASANTITAPAPADAPPSIDAAALLKRNALLEAEAKEARAEAAKYRTRNDEETVTKLKEQGDYKALYESMSPSVEKAKRYDEWQAREAARVDAEKVSLPDVERKAIDKMSTLEDKLELLNDFKARALSGAPRAPSNPPPPPGAAPGSSATIDLLTLTPQQYDELRARDPKAHADAIRRIGGNAAPVPSTAWTQRK
jgi:hypothetical protein